MGGVWVIWKIGNAEQNSKNLQTLQNELEVWNFAINQLVSNNPALFSPYKDDQAIYIHIMSLLNTL